jgi:hypothetical protein
MGARISDENVAISCGVGVESCYRAATGGRVVCVASIWLPRSVNLLHAHPLACMLPAANTLDPLLLHAPLSRSHGCFRC